MLRSKETQQQMRNKVTEIWFCNPFHTDISEAFETSASHSESDCPQMEKTWNSLTKLLQDYICDYIKPRTASKGLLA